jgi:hypothetical protein
MHIKEGTGWHVQCPAYKCGERLSQVLLMLRLRLMAIL